MFKLIVLLAIVNSGLCGIFDFTEFDDPYNSNFFFNRPAVIIRQHHGRCRTTLQGTNQEGVCLTRPECLLGGGQSQGRQTCALGTCCVFSQGCNQVSTKRVSYFEGTTQTDNNVCTYTVRAENNNICQMRLDFDSLDFPAPARDIIPGAPATGVTETDSYRCRNAFFQVESPNNNGRIPTLCGNNNGQHIYVPVNASRGERDLVIKVINNFINNGGSNTNGNSNAVSWKVKITQLECPGFSKHQKTFRTWEDSLLIAPAGCLQYHLAPSGTIRNLGYDTGTTLASNHYEANLNYAICFRRTNDMCGIDFNVDQFSLGSAYNLAAMPPSQCNIETPADSGVFRDTDFLFVPNGVYTSVDTTVDPATTTTAYQDRYCGPIPSNSKIRSVTPGPFYIFFKTDNLVLDIDNMPTATNPSDVTTLDPELGWQLTYTTLYGTNCGS